MLELFGENAVTLRDLIYQIYKSEDIRDNGNGEVSLNCPFCITEVGKKDFKQRLGINVDTGVGHCYRCEKKGGKRYIFRELCRVFGVQHTLDYEPDTDALPKKKEIVKEKSKQEFVLPVEYEPLWKNVNDRIGKKALKYLLDRNITPEQIKQHRIGFCAVGKYAHRIVLPVTYKDQLVGIVARDFSGKAEYKYLNSVGDKSLYNVPKNIAKIANLAEGCFDALALERSEFRNTDCLAALGSKLTKQQLKILCRYRTLILWPDADRPGIEGAIQKAIQLQKKQKQVLIVLPTEEDEDWDLGRMLTDEIIERRKTAIPYSKAVATRLRLRIASFAPYKKKKEWKRNATISLQV